MKGKKLNRKNGSAQHRSTIATYKYVLSERGITSYEITLLSILFAMFVSIIGALTFGNDREINAEVVAIKFVLRGGACVTYK